MKKYLFHIINNLLNKTHRSNILYSHEILTFIIDNHEKLSDDEVKEHITTFFKERCNKLNELNKKHRDDPLNQLCTKLALKIDPEKAHVLLRPDLIELEDVYGNQFNNIKYHEFILSDDEKSLIHFDFFSSIWGRTLKGEKNILKYAKKIEEKWIETPLTRNEKVNILNYFPGINEFFEILESNINYDTTSLLDRLQALREGLMFGDKDHGGAEYIAGESANITIANFYEYFNTLPKERQILLKNLKSRYDKNSFGDILNLLFKPRELAMSTSTAYCVQILGNDCNRIFENNSETLRNIDSDPQFEKLKQLYQIIDYHIKFPILISIINKDTYLFSQLSHFDQKKFADELIVDEERNQTYLHYCAIFSSIQIAILLLKRFNLISFIDLKDVNGETALYMAACNGHFNMVKLLIKYNASVDLAINNGATPLYIASERNHFKIVNYLLLKGANPNAICDSKASPLITASSKGYIKIVQLLLKYGADVNHQEETGLTSLYYASQFGHLDVVKLLIQYDANVNLSTADSNATPLIIASECGHLEIVKIILENGADIHRQKEGCSALYLACQNGHVEVVKYLIDNGADVNLAKNDKTSPLCIASRNGHFEIVNYLLTHNANVNHIDNEKGTPLYNACLHNHVEIVKILIENGAHLEVYKDNNSTPLTIAAQNGYFEVVECLVKHGADIDKPRQGEKVNALHLAAYNGHTKIAHFLINHRADLNHFDNNISVLRRAIYNKHIETAKVILEKYLDLHSFDEMHFKFFNAGNNLTREFKLLHASEFTDIFINHYSTNSSMNVLEKNIDCFEKLQSGLSWQVRHSNFISIILKQLKVNILKELNKTPEISLKNHEKIKSVLNYQRDFIPGMFGTHSIKEYNKLIAQDKIKITRKLIKSQVN